MNKYYTPQIEEFYVGFSCEFFNNMTDQIWKKIECDMDHISIAYDTYEHGCKEDNDSIEETFRVKYLDKEDLIEMGFKLDIDEDIVLHESQAPLFNKARFHEMWTKFGENEDVINKNTENKGQLTGVTILRTVLKNGKYGNTRIDGCIAPNAVYGHLGMKKFIGDIKNKSELKRILRQIGLSIKNNKE